MPDYNTAVETIWNSMPGKVAFLSVKGEKSGDLAYQLKVTSYPSLFYIPPGGSLEQAIKFNYIRNTENFIQFFENMILISKYNYIC